MTRDARRGGPLVRNAAPHTSSSMLRPLAQSPLDELAEHLDGTFVVVVQTSGGRYRRRCFLTAASAERAAANATATGHNAQVYLAELKPLWRLEGHEARP